MPYHVLYFQYDMLFMGSSSGQCQIRHRADLNRELMIQAHDTETGRIQNIGISFDKKALITAA